jgi:putative Holliday junction resolvase
MNDTDNENLPPGRLMGLDLGQARIGVALTDELGVVAMPLLTIERQNRQQDTDSILGLAAEHAVAVVVVGVPYQLDGSTDEQAERALNFIRRLGRRLEGVPVFPWDERLTTREAERVLIDGGVRRKGRREVVDQLAATLILNSFLEARKRDE